MNTLQQPITLGEAIKKYEGVKKEQIGTMVSPEMDEQVGRNLIAIADHSLEEGLIPNLY